MSTSNSLLTTVFRHVRHLESSIDSLSLTPMRCKKREDRSTQLKVVATEASPSQFTTPTHPSLHTDHRTPVPVRLLCQLQFSPSRPPSVLRPETAGGVSWERERASLQAAGGGSKQKRSKKMMFTRSHSR